MLLQFPNRRPFALGAVGYNSTPESAKLSRIAIPVGFDEYITEAIVDTGAPYMVCSPEVARSLGLDPENALERRRLLIRGIQVEGSIHRINVSLLADEGEGVTINTPAFLPNPDQDFQEGFIPLSFLGLIGCLESICFAVDPHTNTFYFG